MTSASRSKGEDVAAVARELTRTQRAVILEAQPWIRGSDQSGPWHANTRTIRSLHLKGICDLAGMFTPLGLAVRAHLTDQEGQNR